MHLIQWALFGNQGYVEPAPNHGTIVYFGAFLAFFWGHVSFSQWAKPVCVKGARLQKSPGK